MVASIVSYQCIYPAAKQFPMHAASRGYFVDSFENPFPIVRGSNLSLEFSCQAIETTRTGDEFKSYMPGEIGAYVTIDGNRYQVIAYSFCEDTREYHAVFIPIAGMQPVQVCIQV